MNSEMKSERGRSTGIPQFVKNPNPTLPAAFQVYLIITILVDFTSWTAIVIYILRRNKLGTQFDYSGPQFENARQIKDAM